MADEYYSNNSTYYGVEDEQSSYAAHHLENDTFSSSSFSSFSSSNQDERFLAGAVDVPTVDYAVISVIVITLALVLAIEVLRHQLDVAASGNKFFQTVLELMYRELTTLGIVEFCIYLMHKYWENFNFKMEAIFVDVHFMLFYTAIFNALQSCCVRLLAGHRTDRAWVKTEDIDIGHYVAIRKEFDRLESELNRAHSPTTNSDDDDTNYQSSSSWKSFKEAVSDLVFTIRHPHLSRRREQLLVPIRFHELRAHFIDSNNLPPKFKVSHYLKRSLTSVLLDFVHISSTAWILLMATANLLYFLSGMILYKTKQSFEVEEFLMYMFFAMMIIFVVFAFILYFKMRSIFSEILHMKLTVYDTEDGAVGKTWRGFTVLNSINNRSVDQMKLFWMHNPHLILEATQYMQFGYALGLALTFTYYKDVKENYSVVDPNVLLLVLLVSYTIFLYLVSKIIPWYTLCTSMGQLVNKERLHETLAKLKLSEEIRKKETLEEEKKLEEEIARRKKEIEAKKKEAAENAAKASRNTALSTTHLNFQSSSPRHGSSFLQSIFKNRSSALLDTGPVDRLTQTEGRNRTWLQHTRKKSLSDGVQLMCGDIFHSATGSSSPTGSARLSAAAAEQLDDINKSPPPPPLVGLQNESFAKPIQSRRTRHRPKKSVSDNVALMRAMNATPFQSDKPLPMEIHVDKPKDPRGQPFSNENQPSIGQHTRRPRSNSLEETPIQIKPELLTGQSSTILGRAERKQRRRLMKTQSEGVFFMRSSLNGVESASKSPMLESLPESSNNLARVCELTQLSTKDLPEVTNNAPKIRPRRQPRSKSASEGVAFMRGGLFDSSTSTVFPSTASDTADDTSGLNGTAPEQRTNVLTVQTKEQSKPTLLTGQSSPTLGIADRTLTLGRAERKQRRRMMKTQSEGVAFMRSSLPREPIRLSLDTLDEKKEPEKLTTLSELTQISTQDLPEIPEFNSKKTGPRQRLRSKVASDGVALMRAGLGEKMPSFQKPLEDANSTADESAKRVSFVKANALRLSSIDSAASDDGCDSDIDDVPEALISAEITAKKRRRLRNIDLAGFFQSSRYRTISLFLPMICFFTIARVEVFMIYAGLFIDQTEVWCHALTPSFWVEVSLYCVMMVEMISVIAVCLTKRRSGGHLFQITAATLGFIVSLVCLLLLLIAEMKRCCSNEDNIFARLLAAASPYSMDTSAGAPNQYSSASTEEYSDASKAGKEEYGACYNPSAIEIECCPKFGSRLYGGLGNIEPFTALICLSPLRFIVAGYILNCFGKGSYAKGSHSDQDSHGHGIDPVEKVRELWLTAIGMHGSIAKTFGLFSKEILECMLGIYHEPDSEEQEESAAGPSESSDGNIIEESTSENELSHHHVRDNSVVTSDSSLHVLASPSSRPSTVKRYESDDFGLSEFEFDDFAYPKARLIRRMRRCERRILPLLDEWILVDVVLTNHELILFDVVDEAETLPPGSPSSNIGGKGLTLSDVAKGRNISSAFSLDDIDFVDIEHRAAIIREQGEAEDVEAKGRHNLLESWQGGSSVFDGYGVDAMNKRWSNVDEDRLKIHFKYNTLYLRFHVDLKEMEGKSLAPLEDSDILNQVGTQTKVWCRTIAHLRGAMNLKQDLPHFGNEDDEMEDFIEMCGRENEGGQFILNNNHRHRRISSVGKARAHRRMKSWVMG